MREGLVEVLIPGHVLSELPNFVPDFLAHLKKIPKTEIEARRTRLKKAHTRIHGDKLEKLTHALVDMGFAIKPAGRWVQVEAKTADEFMAYFATLAGQLQELTPITGNPANLSLLIDSATNWRTDLENVRTVLLRDAFPAPRKSNARSDPQI